MRMEATAEGVAYGISYIGLGRLTVRFGDSISALATDEVDQRREAVDDNDLSSCDGTVSFSGSWHINKKRSALGGGDGGY